MQKVPKKSDHAYNDLQLFADDVEEIFDVFAHGARTVQIQIDDWRLDDAAELGAFAAKHAVAERLRCYSLPANEIYQHDVILSVAKGSAIVILEGETVENRGMLAKLEEIFERAFVRDCDGKQLVWTEHLWDTIVLKQRQRAIKLPPDSTPPESPAPIEKPTANTAERRSTTGEQPQSPLKKHAADLSLHGLKQIISVAVLGLATLLGWLWHKFHS